jgi:WD40 repeat protein
MTHVFQAGSTVREGSFYVERPADEQLLDLLGRGEYCHVLAPRQVGKSSLRLRVENKLEERGIRCAAFDITSIGRIDVSEDRWYFSLISKLARGFGLDDPTEYWLKNQQASVIDRWTKYVREQVLGLIDGHVVVFIDEIESILALPGWRDDFIASIRSFDTSRPTEPAYNRLAFCLIGVAAPVDFVLTPQLTPYNVGRGIKLDDFSIPQCATLSRGLEGLGSDPQALLDEIYSWTHGHPYMTQRLCLALVEQGMSGESASASVAKVVSEVFLTGGLHAAPLLADSQRRMLASPRAGQMLELYGQLLNGVLIPTRVGDEVQIELCLTGMAAERFDREDSHLEIRNRIFSAIFDDDWLKERESERFLTAPVKHWVENGRQSDFLLRGAALEEAVRWSEGREDVSTDERDFIIAAQELARKEEQQKSRRRRGLVLGGLIAAALVVTAMAGLAIAANNGRNEAVAQTERARAALKDAESQRAEADRLRGIAQQEQQNAVIQTNLAEAQQAEAVKQRKIAQATAQREQTARLSALRAVDSEQRAKQQAEEQRRVAIARQLAAQSQIARAQNPQFMQRSALMSIEAVRRYSVPETYVALRDSLSLLLHPSLLLKHPANANEKFGKGAFSVAFSQDGKYVATGESDTARVWDTSTGQEISHMLHKNAVQPIYFVRFIPNTDYVVSATDRTVKVWALSTGKEVIDLKDQDRDVAISDDGKYLATYENIRSEPNSEVLLHVWEIPSGKEVISIHHPNPNSSSYVRRIAFSPDSKFLAAGTDSNSAYVWSATSGQEVAKVTHGSSIQDVAWSPDGQYLATASDDQTVGVWYALTGQPVSRLYTDGDMWAVVFSRDGRYLAASGRDGFVRVWEPRTGKEVARIKVGELVTKLDFSPGGQYLATVGAEIQIWDVITGHEVARSIYDGRVNAVAFHPDGKRLAIASDQVDQRIWELQPGGEINHMTLQDKRQYVTLGTGNKSMRTSNVESIAVSPGMKYTAMAVSGGHFRVWKTLTGQQVLDATTGDYSPTVKFSKDERYIAVTGTTSAMVWDLQTQQLIRSFEHLAGFTDIVLDRGKGQIEIERLISARSSAYDEYKLNSRDIETAPITLPDNCDCRIDLFSLHNWKQAEVVRKLAVAKSDNDGLDIRSRKDAITATSQAGNVTATEFSPDNRYLATSNADYVWLWDLRSGKIVRQFIHGYIVAKDSFASRGTEAVNGLVRTNVNLLAYSPNGKYLASVSGSAWDTRVLWVWETESGHVLRRLVVKGESKTVSFSPNSTHLIYGNMLIDIATGGTVLIGQPSNGRMIGKFSSNGRLLAVASEKEISLYDVLLGREINRMAHDAIVDDISFSLDGLYLASGGDDRTLRVWDTRTGKEMSRINQDSTVSFVAFGADSRYIISANREDTATVLLWKEDDLIRETCGRLTRNLTAAEWKQYLNGEPYRDTCAGRSAAFAPH